MQLLSYNLLQPLSCQINNTYFYFFWLNPHTQHASLKKYHFTITICCLCLLRDIYTTSNACVRRITNIGGTSKTKKICLI